jgi:hypothetical protein
LPGGNAGFAHGVAFHRDGNATGQQEHS